MRSVFSAKRGSKKVGRFLTRGRSLLMSTFFDAMKSPLTSKRGSSRKRGVISQKWGV